MTLGRRGVREMPKEKGDECRTTLMSDPKKGISICPVCEPTQVKRIKWDRQGEVREGSSEAQ